MTCTRPQAESQKILDPRAPSTHDPNVWTRRALQEKPMRLGLRSCTNVSGLVSELMLRTIMEIRARPTSLAAMPRRAIGVISSRMRWKEAFHQRVEADGELSHGALTQRTNRVIPTKPMQPPATAASHKTIASQGNVKQYRSAGVMTRTRR